MGRAIAAGFGVLVLAGCSGSSGADAGSADGGASTRDGGVPSDGGAGTLPSRGGVSLDGGSVDRLYFAIVGDTRPALNDVNDLNPYPTATITRIAQLMEARKPQFALDLGDHMYVGLSGLSGAQEQMGDYLTAIAAFKAPFFLTMGNHECTWSTGNCGADNPTDACFVAFLAALAPTSAKPYYAVDIQTSSGLARFVFVADNAWDATQSAWLTATLADADVRARYTIIARHHNLASTTCLSCANNAAIVGIIQQHKYALHLTGHIHSYAHDTANDATGRTVIIGTGGAPLATFNDFYGYATVVQELDGRLTLTMYDQATDSPIDGWSVGANL